ncbi:DNA-binding response regulator [Sphingomonas lenta]|uniref:DNA-binding response regulator n=2 Tax=Sphingomonas lenta TaxID=1141887 RepID=A0A2A2SHX0_9SPHN|nr:DNA-binding response regulator [Sphingomonas lenta]
MRGREGAGALGRTGRVLIVDDHPLMFEGLAIAVRAAMPGATVDCAESISAAEAIAAQRRNFRLVLLDYLLPDACGFSGLFRLQHALPGVPIVLISAKVDPKLTETARLLGACGFLSKRSTLDTLARQLASLAQGGILFECEAGANPALSAMRDRIRSLSPAQRRVLFALVNGRVNKQIARELDVTEATIKAHMSAIFRKLGVLNRTQAILAVRDLLGPGYALGSPSEES